MGSGSSNTEEGNVPADQDENNQENNELNNEGEEEQKNYQYVSQGNNQDINQSLKEPQSPNFSQAPNEELPGESFHSESQIEYDEEGNPIQKGPLIEDPPEFPEIEEALDNMIFQNLKETKFPPFFLFAKFEKATKIYRENMNCEDLADKFFQFKLSKPVPEITEKIFEYKFERLCNQDDFKINFTKGTKSFYLITNNLLFMEYTTLHKVLERFLYGYAETLARLLEHDNHLFGFFFFSHVFFASMISIEYDNASAMEYYIYMQNGDEYRNKIVANLISSGVKNEYSIENLANFMRSFQDNFLVKKLRIGGIYNNEDISNYLADMIVKSGLRKHVEMNPESITDHIIASEKLLIASLDYK